MRYLKGQLAPVFLLVGMLLGCLGFYFIPVKAQQREVKIFVNGEEVKPSDAGEIHIDLSNYIKGPVIRTFVIPGHVNITVTDY